MASVLEYSPSLDLAYLRYYNAVLESVAAREKINELSNTILLYREAAPDADRIDYTDIETLLSGILKLCYPAQEPWDEKILFCLRRFNNFSVPALTYEQIIQYIKAAEQLNNNSVSQGMEDAVKNTLSALVSQGAITYENGRYSQ